MISEVRNGFETAYIDRAVGSDIAYRPEFLINHPEEGKKVLVSIEEELRRCDEYSMSVAFITKGGVTPLLQVLQELDKKGVPGRILTTDYLSFSNPDAMKTLNSLKNVDIRMFRTKLAEEATGKDTGFHTKGYIFRKEDLYRIIIGSSNLTMAALSTNHEWNTKVVGYRDGEVIGNVVREFEELWESEYTQSYEEFIDSYRIEYQKAKIQRDQQRRAKEDEVVDFEAYRLKPNQMQAEFVTNLNHLRNDGAERALLISATGTGKTYASAFAMREGKQRKVLFLVHREQIAKQAMRSYKKVLGSKIEMALLSGNSHPENLENVDYLFSTMQMMAKEDEMKKFSPSYFETIIIDEAHRTGANSYSQIMDYFKPQMWLGMTASPERTDDFDVFAAFDHNIACEIRLQQALEENLLCPFHYFGITDITIDGVDVNDDTCKKNFNLLTSDRRVDYVLKQAEYYGYSGSRVKGLIFCSERKDAAVLSQKFNERGWNTVVLTGDDNIEYREKTIERLVNDNCEDKLDYIFTVDIFNEGVDIPEVNQVIMLRATKSPIVFVQQLGRGLRKSDDKEYVVVLDFIGNYKNNFMIPLALSGDRSYNQDTIRKYVISGNNIIPGASSIHFDEISTQRIFDSIDKIRGIKTIIRTSYRNLKNRLGRIPYLYDFYENGEVDPQLIIDEFKSYAALLLDMENETYRDLLTEQQITTLEYLSKTILSGTRPYEPEILLRIIQDGFVDAESFKNDFKKKYKFELEEKSYRDAINVLQGQFVSKSDELEKYSQISILGEDRFGKLNRLMRFSAGLQNVEFRKQVLDIVNVALANYEAKWKLVGEKNVKFALYEKYSRRDVSLLMNCGKDLSSTMYGMKRIGDDVFIFVTYHKVEATDDREYVDGKPDYADAFEDSHVFRWDSQIGRGPESTYSKDVIDAVRKHLLVKKSDAEKSFYYMGEFDVVEAKGATKKNNKGKEQAITKFKMKMHHPVREDVMRYLDSYVSE